MPAPIWPAPATSSLSTLTRVPPWSRAAARGASRSRASRRWWCAGSERVTCYQLGSPGAARDESHTACYHEVMDQPASAPKIISCEVLRNEIERVAPGDEIEFVDGALHDYPDKMRA